MGLLAVVQGFKLSVAKFDNFLMTNGLNPTEGYRLFPDEATDIAKLFRAKGVDCELRVFVPYATGFNNSQYLFVSRYVVYHEDDMSWTSEELIRRNTAPIQCGVYDALFSLWQDRMRHRHDKHGISEDQEPLPDC